ncbi:alpha-L-fucosidase [Actinomadura rupiterrae]|uniref:alpha-L-fucosidase n=1 Tax=Actinomadura rupiterrae TaxID=559627 RepID=UPI0020A4BBC5|nr:alpha-L-fucosidase [Actinomadura rupiterrae]MCP2335701.1 alpha-L-fucosidase [Actinomadura rupiterrae]
MRHPTLRASLLAATTLAGLAVPTAASASDSAFADCSGPIRPASVMRIEACDTPSRIIDKAANIVPREGQINWQRKEVTTFTHFGMDTFTNREWGSGAEDEDTFAPKSLDVDQWMRAYKAAGAKQAMFTVKHHDGFVLYPTRYSNHSVIASPWWVRTSGCGSADAAKAARARAEAARGSDPSAYWQVRAAGCENKQGDILAQYVAAARRAGLKVGIYISPADGAELPHAWHREWVKQVVAKHDAGKPLSIEEQATYDDRDRDPSGQGRYGSGSAIAPRTIPTLVKNDDRAKAVAKGKLPSFKFATDEYNAYYLNQLYELFTQYGPIDELWLDGANPWSGEGITEKYDFTAWFDLIHKLSPNTVVFGGPQGIRWIGNENGVARETEWSVTPATAEPRSYHNEWLLPEGASVADIGSRAKLTAPAAKYLQWFPGEADVSLRPGWFFHPDQKPKTPSQLVGLYDQSVGRNASLLLNIPPAADGKVASEDVNALTSFGRAIRETYSRNLLAGARPTKAAHALTDTRLGTSWQGGSLDLNGPTTFDRIRLGQDITRGQHVEGFNVEAWNGSAWSTLVTGTTIGYSRILALPAPVTASRIRVAVTQARATPYITTLGLYRTSAPR